jgi:hypothetical protein
MDVAWWFALDDLLTSLIGRTLPGFPGREAAQRDYEALLVAYGEHLIERYEHE